MLLTNKNMNKNSFFNIKRFAHLLRREAHINLKRDLLILGAMFSLFTIIMFLVFEFGEEEFRKHILESFHFVIFFVMLFLGGAFISSFSFIELRDKMKSHFYLLTPGSTFEKFFVNILISLIAYVLFMLVSYLTYSSFFNWIVLRIYGLEFSGLNLQDENFTLVLLIFILIQSAYFLGATTFKKYPLILTPIAGFIIITFFSISTEITGKIIFPADVKNQFFERSIETYIKQNEFIFKLGLFYILPIIFWFTSYLKLNEKEY